MPRKKNDVEATEVIKEVKPVVDKKVIKKATVTNCERVNVRKEPSKDAGVMFVSPANTTYAVEEELDGWVKISIGTARSGYIMKDFVSIK